MTENKAIFSRTSMKTVLIQFRVSWEVALIWISNISVSRVINRSLGGDISLPT